MADTFDPDAFLATPPSQAKPAAGFNPDAFLGTPVKPDVGRATAFGTGLTHGATANFADELAGTKAAGDVSGPVSTVTAGMPFGAFAPHILGLARLGYEHMMGQAGDANLTSLVTGKRQMGPATTAYEKARDAEREQHKTAKEQYPGTVLAGELGGALAIPAGAAVQGVTLPGRMARGAVAGAGMGAASGFGEGEGLADSATKGAIGVPIGAAVGAVAPPLVEGAIRGARAVTAPLVNAVRGAINPESEAARRIVTAIDRDITSDPTAATRLTPQEYVAQVNQGNPATLMDMGGDLTRRLADVSAITSPEGRTALNRTLNDRFESQSDRVTGWLNNTFGPTDRGLTREALETAATRANRPAYQRAYREGDQPLWSDELQRLVGSPDVVAAMKNAAEKGKSRAIADGFGGFNSSVQVTPSGVVEFTKGKNGVPTYPNLQFWDYTKRALDGAAGVAARSGDTGQAGVLQNLSRQLRGELDTMVPSYQNARAGAARFFGAQDAVDAGERFLTSKMPIAEAQRAFSALSAPERELFRQSYIQSLTQKIESSGDRRSVINSVANTPHARQQMEMVMGPRQAQEFEAMMRVEGIMDMARTAVQGNSWTARRLYDLGLAGGGLETLHGGINQSPGEMTMGAVIAAIASGGKHIDQRVARRVAEMLTSQNPAILRQGVQAVARNQNFMNGLRATDHRITMMGAQEAPALAGPIQGALPVRAQDQQQQQH